VLACELCLCVALKAEWTDAIHRLIGLLEHADWRLEGDVEECLVRHYPKANGIVTAALCTGEQAPPGATCCCASERGVIAASGA
jgi:hypothetical protein